MTKQMRLPIADPSQRIRPDDEHPQPVFWIRRLTVLRELKADAQQVVRSIELRPGLNVLWAPPKQLEGGNALFKDAVAGHTAGKTTFCRLVRHVFGEATFAPEATRRRIREKFPTGWVVGEVLVDRQPWTVLRPLGIGPRPFCVRGSGLEEAIADKSERLELGALSGVLESAAMAHIPARHFPGNDQPIRWGHLLPWLSRDQECRFADALQWRHSSSDSEAPDLAVDDRQFLVRSVLGLISDAEREEQRRNALLVARKANAPEKARLLSHQATVDHKRVLDILQIPQLAPPSTSLFKSEAQSEIERRRVVLEKRASDLSAGDCRSELRASLEGAVAAETNALRDASDVEGRLAVERAALEGLTSQARGDSQKALFEALPPGREFCNVPMDVARQHECPLATSRPIDLNERRSNRTAAGELGAQQEVVRALAEHAERAKQTVAITQAATKEARRAFMGAATSFEEKHARLLEERASLMHAEKLVHHADEAWQTAQAQTEEVNTITSEIKRSYERQEDLREANSKAVARFSATFDYVVRALLGEEVEGRVSMSGRSLSLTVDYQGERDSAALATVKLLAFDLAALTASIEGVGYFPRFLMHDGPREADMASNIYERLFLYARQLESCFEGAPNFQYIVTTTAPPPPSLQQSPWLLKPMLDASSADGRLLGVDL